MLRALLLAGLVLAALPLAPSTSAAHDHPDCELYSGVGNADHYLCAVQVGGGIILQPVLDFAACVAQEPKPTISHVIGCL